MTNKNLLIISGISFLVILAVFTLFILLKKDDVFDGDQEISDEIVNFVKEEADVNANDFSCKDCNLIIISLTNVSASRLGSYGYFRKDISPNIDKFNKDALVFKNAFTVSSWTPPAAASLFTSLYPYAHNLMRWYTDVKPLSENIPTLAGILKKNGFATASFNGGADYDKVYGLNSGFDEYYYDEAFGGIKDVAPFAVKWLEDNKNKKFFLHLQGFDVHCPYYPSEIKYGANYENKNNISFQKCFYNATEQKPQIIENEKYYSVFSSFPPRLKQSSEDGFLSFSEVLLGEEDINHLSDLYDSDINYADKVLGEFLDKIEKMGLYDNTIIVFVSEHGEMIFKNGRMMRGGIMRGNFYEDVAHIPLSIRLPTIVAKSYDGLVSIVDIMPTLLDFLVIDRSDYYLQGKSLRPLIRNDKGVNDYVFGGTEFYADEYNKSNSRFFFSSTRSNSMMIRSAGWKLIEEDLLSNEKIVKNYELYNLKNDQKESDNLFGTGLEIEKTLKEKLESWSDNISIIGDGKFFPIDEELFKEMKARGY